MDTNYFLVGSNIRYLLGLFNSQLFTWIINSTDTPIGNGGAYRHYRYNIENIHIPEYNQHLYDLVDKLLDGDISLQRKIDNLVYELFELTKEEIGFIESQ